MSDIRDISLTSGSASWEQYWARFFDPVGAPLVPSPADLGRLRPDAVAIRWDKRCLYLLEMTRPYDSRPDFAERSDALKMARYQAFVDRFKLAAPEWQTFIVPLTIGVRGSFDERVWTQRLASLDIAPTDIPRVLDRLVAVTLSALDTVYDARNSALRESSP